MKSLKEDVTKLKTVSRYAKEIGKSRQRVYDMAAEGKVEIVEIDGVKFVKTQ